MEIYLSSLNTNSLKPYVEIFPDAKLNVLVSYGLRNKSVDAFLHEYASNINSIILDSGTYTMNFAKSKAVRGNIDFAGYRAFLKTFANRFDYCFSFDCNFDADGRYENDYYMKQLQDDGHTNVVPVVHSYAFDEVESYLDDGHKLIALGYSDDKKTPGNIKTLCNMIHSAGAKAHVLGVSSWNQLASSPVAYCDSSSWVQHSMYGCMQYWNDSKQVDATEDHTDRIKFLDKEKQQNNSKHYFHNYAFAPELHKWIKDTFGWKWYELMDSRNYMKRVVVNIHYFVELQRRITERHKTLGYDM